MLQPTYPTYTLNPASASSECYLASVRRVADDVLFIGDRVRAIVDGYRAFVHDALRRAPCSETESLVELLALGVLWRARGREATDRSCDRRTELVAELVRERRAGQPRRRDGSTAPLVSLRSANPPDRPRLDDLLRLQDWLLASGEYDDELEHFEPWVRFLAAHPTSVDAWLWSIAVFAAEFELLSERSLGAYTSHVEDFLQADLPGRGPCEDLVQCSRRRVEYHFNMVGAELLNRAWRTDFLACRRHVVVLPGCARQRSDAECRASRGPTTLYCAHCSRACAISAATRVAVHAGAGAVAVIHGSDFGAFLRSPELQGGDVGIVGVACVPGLVGAGWRARAQGLPAQCVLLNASGCAHWRPVPLPTSLDLRELARILRGEGTTKLTAAGQTRAGLEHRPVCNPQEKR